MLDKNEANKAIAQLDGHNIDGNNIRVEVIVFVLLLFYLLPPHFLLVVKVFQIWLQVYFSCIFFSCVSKAFMLLYIFGC